MYRNLRKQHWQTLPGHVLPCTIPRLTISWSSTKIYAVWKEKLSFQALCTSTTAYSNITIYNWKTHHTNLPKCKVCNSGLCNGFYTNHYTNLIPNHTILHQSATPTKNPKPLILCGFPASNRGSGTKAQIGLTFPSALRTFWWNVGFMRGWEGFCFEFTSFRDGKEFLESFQS